MTEVIGGQPGMTGKPVGQSRQLKEGSLRGWKTPFGLPQKLTLTVHHAHPQGTDLGIGFHGQPAFP